MKKYEVKEFNIKDTGGNTIVIWGSFTDGKYFSIGSDNVIINDDDERKYMYEEDYEWEEFTSKHFLEEYLYDNEEYIDILKQIYNMCNENEKKLYLFDDLGE